MNMDGYKRSMEWAKRKMINYIEFSFHQKKRITELEEGSLPSGNINYKARSRFELNEWI